MNKPLKKKRILNLEQSIRLTDMVRACRDKFETEKPTIPQAAKYVSQRCGFDVSESSLEGVLKALGIRWIARRQVGGRSYRLLLAVCQQLRKLSVSFSLDVDPVIEEFILKTKQRTEPQNPQEPAPNGTPASAH